MVVELLTSSCTTTFRDTWLFLARLLWLWCNSSWDAIVRIASGQNTIAFFPLCGVQKSACNSWSKGRSKRVSSVVAAAAFAIAPLAEFTLFPNIRLEGAVWPPSRKSTLSPFFGLFALCRRAPAAPGKSRERGKLKIILGTPAGRPCNTGRDKQGLTYRPASQGFPFA